MDARIWSELSQAKQNEQYVCLYSMRQKRRLNYYNIFIALSATIGAISWKSFEYGPFIASVVVALASTLKQVQQYIILDETKLGKLITVQNFYAKYVNSLEMLWVNTNNSRISDEKAMEEFYKLKETENDINPTVNELISSRDTKLTKQAEATTKQYLTFNFN